MFLGRFKLANPILYILISNAQYYQHNFIIVPTNTN